MLSLLMVRMIRLLISIGAVAIMILAGSISPPAALGKAPPHATTILPVDALVAPELTAPVLTDLPADTELTLTGNASPGYLEIEYDGGTAWVPAQYLSLGVHPGIDTAVAMEDLPLLAAPMPDADVLSIVPEGDTVILTGASLDGYDAASHAGVGGWLKERGLAR